VRKLLAVSLLALALLQLGFRGMQRVRTDMPMWDFTSVYSAARTWIHGGNPYDIEQVVGTWRAAGAFSNRHVDTWALVYPPTSLLTVMPLALLPAAPAMMAWLLITLALLALQFAALADLARLRWRDGRAWVLVGAAFAAAPLQFGILSGQLSLPAISLCILAFWCVGRQRDTLAGVLLGIACALKVQIAAPFVLYYLLRRRWNVANTAILVATAFGIAALAAIQVAHPTWLGDWLRWIGASSQVGGVNDYSWAGPFRDEIVDLKILLVSIPLDVLALRIAILCIVVGLIAWYVRSFPARDVSAGDSDRNELLALAGLSAIVLLPVYHRVYDAALLTTALAWALAELDGPRRRWAMLLMVCMLPFLVPFDFVRSIGYRLPGINAMAETWWWQSLIAPHYAWGLLALTIVLLATMSAQAVTIAHPAQAPEPAIQQVGGAAALAPDSDDDEEMILAR
jgi:hypothetical protein